MLNATKNRGLILWLLSGCFIVYIMVVVGCITRLTHSGLSITHWSITGGLPPLTDAQWSEEFSRYQQSPEFLKINFNMTKEEFKSIYFWEWLHRFIGRGILSGAFIGGFIYFLFRKKLKGQLLYKSLFLFFLGAAQGLIGWWMVKSGLVDNPAVSHYRLAIHLMSAFTVFAFTFWFALQLIHENSTVNSDETHHKPLRPVALTLFVVLIAQIVFGAFVAGLKAGLLFPTWPKMGSEWFPSESILVSDSFVKNFFENGAGVQFVHRTFAFVVVTMVALLWWRSNKLTLNKKVHRGISFLIYGTTIQFMLGVFTLIDHVPVLLGVLHQTGAFFLFAGCLYLLFHVYRKEVSNSTVTNLSKENNPEITEEQSAVV